MAHIHHCSIHILHHRRAYRKLLGLSGVYPFRKQIGGRPPARRTILHAHSKLFLTVCRARHCRIHGQHNVGHIKCRRNTVPFLEHHSPCTQARCRQQSGDEQGTDGYNPGIGTCRCACIYMERHILVQRRRGRGVRLLIALYRSCVLAHPQVGGQCRLTAQ